MESNKNQFNLDDAIGAMKQTEPTAEVMFEAPRTVEAKWISRDVEKPKKTTVQLGTLTDWFAPFEVHVYKLKRK